MKHTHARPGRSLVLSSLGAAFLLGMGSAQAQTIERFRFAAAPDRLAGQRFEISNLTSERVNVRGFRHAAGAVPQGGRVYLLGPGVESPDEVPPPRQLTPVSGFFSAKRRPTSPFDLSASELAYQRQSLQARLESYTPQMKSRSRRVRTAKSRPRRNSGERRGLIRGLFAKR